MREFILKKSKTLFFKGIVPVAFLIGNDCLAVDVNPFVAIDVHQKDKTFPIAGTVKDKKRLVLPGVSIHVKGTGLGAITDTMVNLA